jgi:hypothetical protein
MSGTAGPARLSGADDAQADWTRTSGEHWRHEGDVLARFIEPGRRAFELSLALCALSLAFPWLAVLAMAAAGRAWQQGTKRAWRTLLAAAWCFLLGTAVRQFLGLGIFP